MVCVVLVAMKGTIMMDTQVTKLFAGKKINVVRALLSTTGWLSYCVFWVILMLTLQSLWG